jgi:hypothetical protein
VHAKASCSASGSRYGPVFEKLQDAEHWCIHAMISHYDRRLGMSNAKIEPFKGMVACGPPPDPAYLNSLLPL